MQLACFRFSEPVFYEWKTEKPQLMGLFCAHIAYHLGEGRVLKTFDGDCMREYIAYHLGEGRALKAIRSFLKLKCRGYRLGEGHACINLRSSRSKACTAIRSRVLFKADASHSGALHWNETRNGC